MRFLAATFLALTCSPLWAQSASTGTLVPGKSTSSPIQTSAPPFASEKPDAAGEMRDRSSAEAIQTLHAVAACVVKKDQKGVGTLFGGRKITTVRSEYWPKANATLSACLSKEGGGQLGGRSTLFFGALAQQLYLKSYPKLPVIDDSKMDFSFFPTDRPEQIVIDTFADCLVLKAPANADQLMRTPPESLNEVESFRAISSLFPSCLPREYQLKVKRSNLRLAMANVLYRRAIGTNLGIKAEGN